MATTKGQEFINKYNGTDCLKSSWEMMYKKGHITLDEFAECANLKADEIAQYQQQIDNCYDQPKTNAELTEENKELRKDMDDLVGMVIDLQYQLDINNI